MKGEDIVGFVEKPNLENAQKFLNNKQYSWNSGIFLFKAKAILDEINKFKPEIILVSAGFDAHIRDPLANINLQSEDFFKITKNIVDIANIHSKGRVISFLEGGYDLKALSESIIEHLNALKSHI